MSIVVPGVAQAYPGPYTPIPSRIGLVPREGQKAVNCEVDWGSMGGPNNTLSFNLQDNNTLALSQIIAFSVDNSQCGCDVQFVFTDTAETLTIPAYTAKAIVEVHTRSLQFYLVAGIDGQVVESEYITRFAILNYLPPPVVVPASEEQNAAVVGGISFATPSTQIVPTGVSGSIENAYFSLGVNASNSGNGTWQLKDGGGNVLAQGSVAFSSGDKFNIALYTLTNGHIPFNNGLVFTCTETAVLGATINVNLYYRTP